MNPSMPASVAPLVGTQVYPISRTIRSIKLIAVWPVIWFLEMNFPRFGIGNLDCRQDVIIAANIGATE